MWIDYGKVRLKVVDILRFDRESVYTEDRMDLQTVRTTIGVAATYAPNGDPRLPSVRKLSKDTEAVLSGSDRTAQIINQNLRGQDPGVAEQVLDYPVMEHDIPETERIHEDEWMTGPQTDAELRQRLMLPRQKLVVWAYDRQSGQAIRWFESPRPGMVCDAVGGPFPLGNPIVSMAGEPHSVAVYFEVQTELQPCPVGSDRFVLSHRWQMRHVHDENYYLTRVIDGTIVFNGEAIHTIGIRPDSVRNQFLHPIPVGFQRQVPVLTQSMDGLTIRYTITDTDPTIMFSPGDSGATHIDILERVIYNKPLVTQEGSNAGFAPTWSKVGSAASGAALGSFFGPIGTIVGGVGGYFLG